MRGSTLFRAALAGEAAHLASLLVGVGDAVGEKAMHDLVAVADVENGWC
jgi:hypothetical protein